MVSATFTFVLYHGESWTLVTGLFVAGQQPAGQTPVMCSGNAYLDGFVDSTLPETNSSHLKMDGWNTSFLLGWPMFRCELLVSGGVFF